MLAVFTEPGFAQLILLLRFKIQRRYIIEYKAYFIAQYLYRMIITDLLDLLLLRFTRLVQVPVNAFNADADSLVFIQVIGYF